MKELKTFEQHLKEKFTLECQNIILDIRDLTEVMNESDWPKEKPLPWKEILRPLFVNVTIH